MKSMMMFRMFLFFVLFSLFVVDGLMSASFANQVKRKSRLYASSAEKSEVDDDDNIEVIRELFLQAVGEEEAGALLKSENKASLYDLDDVQFKMYMLKRLGKEDYDRIFSPPRVDFDIR
uniref:RxLR effector protein n=1 Tax=Aureoumbra lagunensis TaxID=44058 RepID=A0A7S3NKU8_9STRA|mmetsp:Transcript_22352/g.28919  ORF Transcript_22352/g.28919 Transcript_22352/m.28919 type:complete len:119 (+) Transcript_22352:18-374(+)